MKIHPDEKPCLIIENRTFCEIEPKTNRVYAKQIVKFVTEDLEIFETVIPLKYKVLVPHYASYWWNEKKQKYMINPIPNKELRTKARLILYKYF